MSTDIKRHPLAIAWDEWLASPEGQGCANFGNLTTRHFLENRLHAAFSAGASHFDEVVAAATKVIQLWDVGKREAERAKMRYREHWGEAELRRALAAGNETKGHS